MKEFVEKLIGRLEELQKLNYEAYETAQWNNDKIMFINASNAYANAITEVNQLAEEYKEECEYKEKFPESGNIYFLTGCNNRHNGFLNKNRPYCGFCGKKIRVAPYQPKGE